MPVRAVVRQGDRGDGVDLYAWRDTLGLLFLVAILAGAIVWLLKRPVDSGSVPRDFFASKAKATAAGPGLFVWPRRAYQRTLIDTADDASHGPVDTPDDATDPNCHELVETPEHHKQVVDDLKQGL
jgi:hypothetical protein